MNRVNNRCDGGNLPALELLFSRGFSLIEVVIALSIISSAFVIVLGLLPIGLSGLRQAMDSSIERQIAQQITDELLQTPFSKLQESLGILKYYDDQGLVVSDSTQGRYRATTKKAVTEFPGSFNAPAATPVDQSALMLQIQVSVAPSGAKKASSTSEYNILVPNSGN